MNEPAQVQREWLETAKDLLHRYEVAIIGTVKNPKADYSVNGAHAALLAHLQAYPAQHPATGEPVAWMLQSKQTGLIHGLVYKPGAKPEGCDEYDLTPLYAAPVPVEDARTQEALRRALRLIDEALPKFNWRASALDANAIRLLNEVPSEIRAALASPPPAQGPT